jgi:tetratricopeptide (TPR) repeat protein
MSSSEQDRRIVMSAPAENLDLESRSWVEKNARLLVVGVGVIIVLAGIWAYVNASSAAREEAAALAAAEATTAEDFLSVARQYAGTQRAAIAYIQAASLQNADTDWEGLRKTAEEFLSKHPKHPADFYMRLALATALEGLGQRPEALSLYKETAAKDPDSFRAPEALFRAGVIEQESDNVDEARRLFDSVVEKYPASIWAGQARQRIAQLPAPAAPPLLKSAEDVTSAAATQDNSSALTPTPVRPPEEAPLIPPEP